MKVFFFGNTGSGKSLLIERIKPLLDWPVIAIDHYRERFGNYQWSGYNAALKNFLQDLRLKESQLIECSGYGKTGQHLRAWMPRVNGDIRIVILDCHWNRCLERSSLKLWGSSKLPDSNKPRTERIKKGGSASELYELYAPYPRMILETTEDHMLDINIDKVLTFIK